ncbi:MAG: ATP-binding protein, partial [Verrucomicrobiales bacterium]|nr:ATP-binding protein [Verrucomicrobiales bacterium]
GEQVELLKELQLANEKVTHMRQIIDAQLNRATTSGLMELLLVRDLVEASLRLNAAALEAQNIQIHREFSEAPPIATDKHKVLQILVNLVTNAIQAMDKTGRKDRLLTLRIDLNGQQGIRISVADNGMGIAPENLSRIFEQGFTTRKGGHGLGLHGSALLAGELGGKLSVESPGLGHGAVFTVELPFKNRSCPP